MSLPSRGLQVYYTTSRMHIQPIQLHPRLQSSLSPQFNTPSIGQLEGLHRSPQDLMFKHHGLLIGLPPFESIHIADSSS